MKNNITLYHLSHIDLDGYGCQYLTSMVFSDIRCYNANYGPEVTARLDEIFRDIQKDRPGDNDTKRLILVTDLNLSTKECNKLEKDAAAIGSDLLLLDHHATGASAAERFFWYRLDTSRCATMITYDWLRKEYGFDSEKEYADIVEAINAIDIWQDKNRWFEYGKVMLGMISGAKEINRILFPDDDRSYKLNLIEKAREMAREGDILSAHIRLDEALHANKKSYFFNGTNNTKDNLVAEYVTTLLNSKKDTMTIYYRNHKGLLGYNIGSASLIGNTFLSANPEFDFYMDLNSRGNFSLRSIDRVDVSQMAAEIGNGGGHPNAGGGKIENYKDSFVYEDLRESIQEYIDDKTGNRPLLR